MEKSWNSHGNNILTPQVWKCGFSLQRWCGQQPFPAPQHLRVRILPRQARMLMTHSELEAKSQLKVPSVNSRKATIPESAMALFRLSLMSFLCLGSHSALALAVVLLKLLGCWQGGTGMV